MKNILIIALILLTSCNNAQDQYNPEAVKLNNEAVDLMTKGMISQDEEKDKLYNQALILFDEAINIDSSLTAPYNNKVTILVELKEYLKAIEVLNNLLNRNPDLAEGYFFLGILSEAVNDTIDAYKFYNKSISIFIERISQGKMIEANEINLACSYIMTNEEEKGNKLLQKYLSDGKYGFTAEILYKKKREEIINELLKN